MAGKKKTNAQKKAAAAARAVSPLPETNNTTGNAATGATTAGAADVPDVTVDDKQESKIEVSEPNNEATKDTASTPTPAPTTPTTETPVATADTPSAPLSKAQKKKARKASAGASGAITPVQTIDNKPSDNPESTAMNGGLDDAKTTAEDGKAAANGLGEPTKENDGTTEPATPEVDSAADDAWGFDDAETSPAERVKSPAAPSEAGTVMVNKLESDDTPSSKLNGATPDPNSRKLDDKPDNTPPSDPAPPPSITSPDGVSKASDVPISSDPHSELPKRGTLPPETSGSRESGTRTSGMPAVDDDEAPLVPPKTSAILKTPTNNMMTSKPASAQVEPEPSQNPGATATPKPQQQSPVSPVTPANATPTGQGLFSNGPVGVKPPPSPSASSPTSGVPGTRGPGSVGFGSVGLGSTRPSASSASFGFGQSQQKPTNLPPPPSATPSWGAPKSTPSPAASSSKPAPPAKPAAKGWGWGGFTDFVDKARNAVETALADEPAPTPPVKPTRQQAPVPAPNPAPAPEPKKISMDERLAALRAKTAARKAAAESKPESPAAPPSPAVTVMEARAPESPVTPTKPAPKPSMIPTLKPNASISSNSILSPIKPGTSANPLSLSSPSNAARESEVTSSPVTAQVTEDSAAPPARAESVVSSKTVGSGLRLSMDADKERERPGSASSLPTNPPSMIPRRPSLVDMRSTSSPSPKTPGGTFSPFGAGLGQNRFNNGRPGFGFAGFAGASRFNSIEEDKKEKEKDKMDDDLSSVVSESVQDVDSLVDMGKDEEEEQPQLGSTEDLAALVDPTVQSEPAVPPAPIVVAPLEPIALPKPIAPEATILEPTVPVPQPISAAEPKLEPAVVPPSPLETEPLIPALAPAPESETQHSLVEPEAQPDADTTEAFDVDEAEFDLDDKTVAAPPDLGSPERIAALLPDISTGFSLMDEPNPWGQDVMKVEETSQVQEAPMAEEAPKAEEEPQVVEEPQVEEAKSQEPLEVEKVPKIEQTPEVEEPLRPEPTADPVAQEDPIASNDAAPTAEVSITEPPAAEPLAIDPVPAPETVDLPASPDVEIPKPVEQPPTEPAPTASMLKKDRKRAKKALAIEVPPSQEPSSSSAPKSAMPKSPSPVSTIPKSPAPISVVPKSPIPTSALPASPTTSAFVPASTAGNKKKKKKGKKAVEPVEEPAPTTEPSVVEPPAGELEHVAELVPVVTEATSVAAVEEKPVVEEISPIADETPAPVKDAAVVETSASAEIPVVDSTPALVDPTPEVTEPALVALEVEEVNTPKFDSEVAVAPVQTEPAPEAVHTEEVPVPEVKGDELSEAIVDALATPKVKEMTLPEEPKDPAPDPIFVSCVEEPRPKEGPASPSVAKSSRAAKKAAKKAAKRRDSLHVSEPGPPLVAEPEPIPLVAAEELPSSPVGAQASPVLPPSKEPEVVDTPTEVVAEVETVHVDELPKQNKVVEELLGNNTPRPVAHELPDAVGQVDEGTLISFSDAGVEEMKVEVVLDPEAIDGTDVAKTPKTEVMVLEEPDVKESQLENPKTEEAAVEEPLVVITEVPITPEPIVMDLTPEETPVVHVAETIPAAPVPEVLEAPPTPVAESSKKNKRKKKKEKEKEKEKAVTKTEVVEGPAPVESEAPMEPISVAEVEQTVVFKPTVETVDEKPVPTPEKPESIVGDIAIPETAIEPTAPKSPLEAGTSDAPALPAAPATTASPVESMAAKPFAWSISPKSPSVPAGPASPISPKEKEKAKSPVTPVESRFSFFRHLLRKPDPIPMPEPQAEAETSDMRPHSPTASELALDLDTPVNLTPRITEAKLSEVQSTVEVAPVPVEPLPAFTEPIPPISEPPTPELHHEVLEKKLSMALEQAESILEEQETHPESTSMPDPPPAYSSPKMEPTTEVARSIVVSEPEATPETPRPEVTVQVVTVSRPAVEPQPELHAEPNVVAEPKVVPKTEVPSSSGFNPEPINPSYSTAVLDPIASESEPVKRKKRSSKKIKRDKTPDVPRNIEPVVAAAIIAETPFVAPLPSVDPVRKPSTPPVDGLPPPMPELLSSKNRGFASPVLPFVHESTQAAPISKPKTRAAMPPLISIPVANTLEESSRKEPSMKGSAESDLETRPPLVPTSSATQTSAPQAISPPTLTPKASYDTFSPFRWLGFGPSASSAPAAKTPECTPNTASQVATEAEAPLPTPVSPLKEDKKERKEKSSRVFSTSTSNIVLTRTPTSPSPAVEKIEWSRWPYRPATAESKHEKVPTTRGSEAARTESRTATSRTSSQGTATPVVSPDVISPSAISPAVPTPPPVTPVSARPATTQSSRASLASTAPIIPVQVIPVVPLAAAVQETTPFASQEATRPKDSIAAREDRRKERAEKRAAAQRASAISPISHTPSVSFQSPRSTDEPLPMHSPRIARAESLEAGPRPTPRGILKQRTVDTITNPSIPRVTPTARGGVTKLEFTGSRDVPIYDDWEHAPKIRQDILAATSSVRSPHERRTPGASPVSPGQGRSPVVEGSHHRHRLAGLSPGVTSPSSKAPPTYAPSPSTSSDDRSTTKGARVQPELVPTLHETTPRVRPTLRTSRIAAPVLRSPADTYVETLASPILLASDNYSARVPEGTIYQYDVQISPSESLTPTIRKEIFDVLQKTVAPQVFTPLARASYDGRKMMYAHRKLNVRSKHQFLVELPGSPGSEQVYTVSLKRMAEIAPQIVPAFRG